MVSRQIFKVRNTILINKNIALVELKIHIVLTKKCRQYFTYFDKISKDTLSSWNDNTYDSDLWQIRFWIVKTDISYNLISGIDLFVYINNFID